MVNFRLFRFFSFAVVCHSIHGSFVSTKHKLSKEESFTWWRRGLNAKWRRYFSRDNYNKVNRWLQSTSCTLSHPIDRDKNVGMHCPWIEWARRRARNEQNIHLADVHCLIMPFYLDTHSSVHRAEYVIPLCHSTHVLGCLSGVEKWPWTAKNLVEENHEISFMMLIPPPPYPHPPICPPLFPIMISFRLFIFPCFLLYVISVCKKLQMCITLIKLYCSSKA